MITHHSIPNYIISVKNEVNEISSVFMPSFCLSSHSKNITEKNCGLTFMELWTVT